MGFIAPFLKKESYDTPPCIYENHNSIPRGVGPRDESLQPYCKLRDIVSLTAVVSNSWTVCCIVLKHRAHANDSNYYATSRLALYAGQRCRGEGEGRKTESGILMSNSGKQ